MRSGEWERNVGWQGLLIINIERVDIDWSSTIIHENDRATIMEKNILQHSPNGFYISSDTSPIPGPTEPRVYAMHEPPSLPSTPAEAHLYLSPSHIAGKGNHSFAYHAEWDVPRDLLVPDNASLTKRRKLSPLKTRKGQTRNGLLNAGKSSSRNTSGLNM